MEALQNEHFKLIASWKCMVSNTCSTFAHIFYQGMTEAAESGALMMSAIIIIEHLDYITFYLGPQL